MIFDWQKPIGYIACQAVQAISIFTIANVFACSLNTTIGHCVYAADFVTDLEESLREFNEQFDGKNENRMDSRKQLEIQRNFIEIIEFYSNARE